METGSHENYSLWMPENTFPDASDNFLCGSDKFLHDRDNFLHGREKFLHDRDNFLHGRDKFLDDRDNFLHGSDNCHHNREICRYGRYLLPEARKSIKKQQTQGLINIIKIIIHLKNYSHD